MTFQLSSDHYSQEKICGLLIHIFYISKDIYIYIYIYLPIPPLGQDMTQGQFLSLTCLNLEFFFS